LQATILNKRAKKIKKGEEIITLTKNNEGIIELICKICRNIRSMAKESVQVCIQQQHGNSLLLGPNPKIKIILLNCIGNIIKRIQKCSIEQAREFLTKAISGTVIFRI